MAENPNESLDEQRADDQAQELQLLRDALLRLSKAGIGRLPTTPASAEQIDTAAQGECEGRR